MKYLKQPFNIKNSALVFISILCISQLYMPSAVAAEITKLTTGKSSGELTANLNNSLLFSIDVPQGATDLLIKTGDHVSPGIPSCVGDGDYSSCQGDSVLYVKYGSVPTLTDYDCIKGVIENNATSSGYENEAECSFNTPQAGTYFIRMYAKTMFYSAFIEASFAGGSSDKTYSADNLSLAKGQWLEYYLDIPVGTHKLKIEMSGGSGDADLYVSRKHSNTKCTPLLDGNNEACTFNNPSSGRWLINIKGYKAASGVNIKITVSP